MLLTEKKNSHAFNLTKDSIIILIIVKYMYGTRTTNGSMEVFLCVNISSKYIKTYNSHFLLQNEDFILCLLRVYC